jgi:hypothetical protein
MMTAGEHNKDMNPAQDDAAQAPRAAEQRAPRLVSRRALVRAGWVAPVVLALSAPANAVAGILCVSGTTHTDTGSVSLGTHVDICV